MASATNEEALRGQIGSREIVARLRRLRLVGPISPTYRTDDSPRVFALLVPRGIALDELNLDRDPPLTDADLARVLTEMRVDDYPQRARAHSRELRREEQNLLTPQTLPEGSYEKPYLLEFCEDGYPEVPACLD
jgi:hypothetical protein